MTLESAPSSDFFRVRHGSATPLKSRPQAFWRLLDRLYDRQLERSGELQRLRAASLSAPQLKVLVVGIEVPTRPGAIHEVLGALCKPSRHRITLSVVPMGAKGKFQNIDDAIRLAPPIDTFDWLAIVDDDIGFAAGLLDDALLLSDAAGLSVTQPAHAFESHASYAVTRRRWESLARETRFVEIGPMTLIKADVSPLLIPFPDSRWGYGIDLVWSELVHRHGHTMGVIDGTPLRHLRPVAGAYDFRQAVDEGQALIRRFAITGNRRSFLSGDRVVIGTGAPSA